jgi:sodium/potassium/calcium exchanger 6
MCDVVDEYIAEALIYITKWLKFSEALAGVTLLALANGAGDLITAVVSSDGEEGVNYNIGSLLGAGLFVITIVLTLTIRAAPFKIKVDKNVIYRDVVFYIIGVSTVIIFGIVGELTWWSSTIMLLEYWMLVMTVMF